MGEQLPNNQHVRFVCFQLILAYSSLLSLTEILLEQPNSAGFLPAKIEGGFKNHR